MTSEVRLDGLRVLVVDDETRNAWWIAARLSYRTRKRRKMRGADRQSAVTIHAGLGLYIVRQIVEAHGGEVSVASVEGVGTSTVLKLPVRRAQLRA